MSLNVNFFPCEIKGEDLQSSLELGESLVITEASRGESVVDSIALPYLGALE